MRTVRRHEPKHLSELVFKRGMKPFRPNAKQTLKTYYEVPVDIIEDPDQLTGWAQKAIQSQVPKRA